MNAPIKLKTIKGPKADFNVSITVLDLGGQEVEIDFTCKARTKTEWAPIKKKIMAERMEDLRKQAEAAIAASDAEGEDKDAEAQKRRTIDAWKKALERVKEFEDADAVEIAGVANEKQAEFAGQIATGWSLDIPMTAQNLADLEDEFPGSISKLIEKYDAAVLGARTKN
jgi:hypothetical protein